MTEFVYNLKLVSAVSVCLHLILVSVLCNWISCSCCFSVQAPFSAQGLPSSLRLTANIKYEFTVSTLSQPFHSDIWTVQYKIKGRTVQLKSCTGLPFLKIEVKRSKYKEPCVRKACQYFRWVLPVWHMNNNMYSEIPEVKCACLLGYSCTFLFWLQAGNQFSLHTNLHILGLRAQKNHEENCGIYPRVSNGSIPGVYKSSEG